MSQLDAVTTQTFRTVPRTGVIYVMSEASKRGFSYGDTAWANLGQGAPETGRLPGSPERINTITFSDTEHEYAPVAGLIELREAVAELYNRRYRNGRKSKYTAENVAIASGGRLSLSRLAAALGHTHLGHFLPDYTAYEELLGIFQRFNPIPIPLEAERGYAMSPGDLHKEIVSRGLGAILLSNPANPTGKLVAGAQLESYVDVARKLESFLLFDEYYAHYIWDGGASPFGSVSAAAYVGDVDRDPIVIIDGLTKNWRYPGWRIGWTVGPKTLVQAVSAVGSFLDGGAPHPLQKAALQLVDYDVAEAEAIAIRKHFMGKRELVLKRLLRMGIRVDIAPAGAFYVWGCVDNLPEGLNSGKQFFLSALDNKVITVPGIFFDVNPGNRRTHSHARFANYIRFSFGPEIDSLMLGLDRLEQMIADAKHTPPMDYRGDKIWGKLAL